MPPSRWHAESCAMHVPNKLDWEGFGMVALTGRPLTEDEIMNMINVQLARRGLSIKQAINHCAGHGTVSLPVRPAAAQQCMASKLACIARPQWTDPGASAPAVRIQHGGLP